MAKQIWNGILVGIALSTLGLWAIKGAQAVAPTTNWANTIYGWFADGANYLITNVSWLSGFSETTLAFVIAGLIGLLIGLWVEYK